MNKKAWMSLAWFLQRLIGLDQEASQILSKRVEPLICPNKMDGLTCDGLEFNQNLIFARFRHDVGWTFIWFHPNHWIFEYPGSSDDSGGVTFGEAERRAMYNQKTDNPERISENVWFGSHVYRTALNILLTTNTFVGHPLEKHQYVSNALLHRYRSWLWTKQ